MIFSIFLEFFLEFSNSIIFIGKSYDAVEMLIKAGVSIHEPNSQGVTPFQLACCLGNVPLIKLMVENDPR